MRPRLAWILALGYAAVVVQTTLVAPLRLGALKPDLVLAVVVFLALWAPAYPALILAWCLGLAKDLTSGGPLGAWAVLFLGAAAWIVAVRGKFFIRKALTQALLAGSVAVPMNAVYLALRWGTAPASGQWWMAPLLGAASGASTAAATPFVAWLLGRCRRRLGLLEREGVAS